MNRTDLLRMLPAVDEVLRCESMVKLAEIRPRVLVTRWIRESIDDVRDQLLEGKSPDLDTNAASESILQSVLKGVHRRLQRDGGGSMKRVINATGVILHTNLGRAPLAPRAVERMAESARYSNVELNLESGRRSQRGNRAIRLIAQLVGAEDALVVNNCAAATILVLQAIACEKEVIVSRGQLVEIGGGFRLPDVFRSAGVTLKEVGTTNRTYLRDYEGAISEQTGAIIRVHRSNFKLTGFVTEPSIDELVSVRPSDELPVIDDIGSGCIDDLRSYGLDEPTVPSSVRSGADLTLFSGDKLFGGPQCGIVVGRSKWIARLRQHPLMRALRVDKLTLAALEATTEIHLEGNALSQLPSLAMITISHDEVHQRCERLRAQLVCSGSGRHDEDEGSAARNHASTAVSCETVNCESVNYQSVSCEIVACQSQVGGGSVPGSALPSWAVRLSGSSTPDTLANRLRMGTPAIQSRITEDGVLLDMRTVFDDEVDVVAARLNAVLSDLREQGCGE